MGLKKYLVDVALIVGLALIDGGIWMLSPPGALIFAGTAIVALVVAWSLKNR